jgi:hypothetical protein
MHLPVAVAMVASQFTAKNSNHLAVQMVAMAVAVAM